MEFPQYFSFTITNHCNLRCWMCGQWSEEGYIKKNTQTLREQMVLEDWMRVIDELAANQVQSVLLRGGEPLLYPDIVPLLEYLNAKGIFVSIDTNATMLEAFADDIVRIGNIHLTISIDGPEAIHDRIRGVPGTFDRVRRSVSRLQRLTQGSGREVSQSINFTILPESVPGLGQMPDVARSLSIKTMAVVPYYYFPESVGTQYQRELDEHFGCAAYSWKGFHHEDSGVDFKEFRKQYQLYKTKLGDIYNFPYMDLDERQYQIWFEDPKAVVDRVDCMNVEKLIDIQPNGDANFCVDFPDYVIGNVKQESIAEMWNSERAVRFRAFRRSQSLAICFRCGAKYMAEL